MSTRLQVKTTGISLLFAIGAAFFINPSYALAGQVDKNWVMIKKPKAWQKDPLTGYGVLGDGSYSDGEMQFQSTADADGSPGTFTVTTECSFNDYSTLTFYVHFEPDDQNSPLGIDSIAYPPDDPHLFEVYMRTEIVDYDSTAHVISGYEHLMKLNDSPDDDAVDYNTLEFDFSSQSKTHPRSMLNRAKTIKFEIPLIGGKKPIVEIDTSVKNLSDRWNCMTDQKAKITKKPRQNN